MLYNKNLNELSAYSQLNKHSTRLKKRKIQNLFDTDPKRFQKFSIQWNEFIFDYSKNLIDKTTLLLLIKLARQAHLPEAIKSMFSGEKINITENRSVLHTALRNFSEKPVYVDNNDVMPLVKNELKKIKVFTDCLHKGMLKGYSGKKIENIINIGIGGSDLGPAMVTQALKSYHKPGIHLHFVSNVDGSHLYEVVKQIKPETCLFIIASKTFTTQETMLNAHSARAWFLTNGGKEKDIKKHFVAVSTNREEVIKFGIEPKNMFEFWDWVGGRYSVWSSIGLPVACAVGFKHFNNFLNGSYEMDVHFSKTPFERNIPVLLGLLGIWYRNFFSASSHVVIPYEHNLSRFPGYLQQLDMESNGKSINRNGKKINYSTGSVIWGEPGTNAQHSFFQLLHQGREIIPCDFILSVSPSHPFKKHHPVLVANCLAQSEALMKGKSKEEVFNELKISGKSEEEIAKILPYKVFEGNRPSNTFLIKKLTPRNLGSLLAMYEHKVFVQGVLWNIFSFDQWGVELGKQLAGKILSEIQNRIITFRHDSSTKNLIRKVRSFY